MDERALAERLIGYDTSKPEELVAAASFVKGWLGSREIEVVDRDHNGLPVIRADVGATSPDAPTVVFHGHIDVVPAHPEQFAPRVEGDRLIGRGAYDMKGALAAMLCAVADVAQQDRVRVRFVCVPDEESEDVDDRSIDALIGAGSLDADFAITGEPTDLHIGVQAKGVLAIRIAVRGTAAHGSTPWLGDNAILKTHDAFRRIETLPFSRESSDLFETARRSTSPASPAGTPSTRCPTAARPTSTSAICPTRTPAPSSPRSATSPTSRSSGPSSARRRSSRGATPTCSRCATRSPARRTPSR